MTPEQVSTLNPFIIIGLLMVVLNLIGFVAAAAVLFVVKRALADLRLLEGAFNDFAKALPELYIRKDDYRADIHEMKGLLRDIFTKLDGKADKPR